MPPKHHIWHLSGHLPCSPVLKAFGMPFRVRYTYICAAQGECGHPYTILCDSFLDRSPFCNIPHTLATKVLLPGLLLESGDFSLSTLPHTSCDWICFPGHQGGGQREKKSKSFLLHSWTTAPWSKRRIPLPPGFRCLSSCHFCCYHYHYRVAVSGRGLPGCMCGRENNSHCPIGVSLPTPWTTNRWLLLDLILCSAGAPFLDSCCLGAGTYRRKK